MSYQAYQKTQQSAETPSQVEYRLLAQVTSALLEASKLDRMDPKTIRALDWNRRVWSVLATDCSVEGNQLPDKVRAGIISLSIWVSKHTSGAIRGGVSIDPLIKVNRSIMEGLATQHRSASQSANPSQGKKQPVDSHL